MPYLIETRPEFVDRAKFMGSDYFLERVGLLNADQILKRLGDSHVETRLIRDQIFTLTGYRFLGGARDDREQMQALYDNAIDAHQSLDLTIGVALNPSQIAALGNDIIWLERHTIQGQEVLVPRLYLASSTLQGLDPSSARIAGSETIIKSAYLVNTGTIVGTNALTLEATRDLFNQGGSLLSQGNIDIDVGGLFSNQARTVLAGGATRIAADSIFNTGSITGTTGLSLRTVTDLVNQGGSLLSEGNIGITAGGLFANRSGIVRGGGDVSISAATIVNEALINRTETRTGFTEQSGQVATIEAGGQQ